MKKFIKSRIFSFMLGAVIFGSISVYAYSLKSSDISFNPENSEWQVTNLEEAVNYLYSVSKEYNKEINIPNLYFNDKGGSEADGYLIYDATNYSNLHIDSLGLKNSQAYDWTHFYVYGINGDSETELYYVHSKVVALQTYEDINVDVSDYEKIKIAYKVFGSYITVDGLSLS